MWKKTVILKRPGKDLREEREADCKKLSCTCEGRQPMKRIDPNALGLLVGMLSVIDIQQHKLQEQS